jgi:hypothetical protein
MIAIPHIITYTAPIDEFDAAIHQPSIPPDF